MKFINKKYSFLILLPIFFGFFISFYSWDGVVYFFDRDNSRVPADNTSIFSLSNLKSRIQRNSYEKIVSDLTIISQSGDITNLNFKNFYLKEKKLSVCKAYKNIQLSFIALNVAVSGEPPTITINAPCTEDISNSGFIATISIPLSDIKNLQPSSDSFLYENSEFNFSNIEDEWPIDFRLNKVEFKNFDEEGVLTIKVFDSKPSIEFQL